MARSQSGDVWGTAATDDDVHDDPDEEAARRPSPEMIELCFMIPDCWTVDKKERNFFMTDRKTQSQERTEGWFNRQKRRKKKQEKRSWVGWSCWSIDSRWWCLRICETKSQSTTFILVFLPDDNLHLCLQIHLLYRFSTLSRVDEEEE